MRLSILAVLVMSVATCGQKGPLHLPEPEARNTLVVLAAAHASRV